MLGSELFLTLLALDRERRRAGQRPLAHVHGDLVFLHQVGDTLIELFRHAAAALHHRFQIGFDRACDLQAIGAGMVHIVVDLGRAQQRLGRDAAPVEADAAQMLALDNRGLQAELRAADRRDIAAGAGTENDDVITG